jgi:hypothetical protein
LALKRAMQEAVKGGYDKLVISPGQANADLYSLEKQFDKIRWHPQREHLRLTHKDDYEDDPLNVRKDELPNQIGKDLTQRLLASEPDKEGYHHLSGGDLRHGGEGMRKFYDRDVPKRLNKLAQGIDPTAQVRNA